MKKTKLFGLALIATMTSFSACTNDAEEVLTQESEIRLTSEITSSRVTSPELQSTQIVAGRQIGVTITGAKSRHNNQIWTAAANGSLTYPEEIYWGVGNASFYAYHPYNVAWTGNSHTFSVQTDQSTDEGFLNSDLLYAVKEDVAHTENAVLLPFVHCLSKINITLSNADISESKKAIVYICGTIIDVEFNPIEKEGYQNCFSSFGNMQEIKVGEITDNSQTISAIIVPQVVKADTKFIRIEFNNKNYYYILPSEQRFNGGATYSLNLNLKNKEELVELNGLNIYLENWLDENLFDSSSNAGEEDGITDIYVGKEGTLSTLIETGESFSYLKLSGKINDSDLSYIESNFRLKYLDLSDASYDKTTIHLSLFEDFSLNYLSLPKNIKIVGENFGDLAPTSLNTIIIPANVTAITSDFSTYLKEIRCKATTPPTLYSTLWTNDEYDYSHLKIYVPEGSKSVYEAADIWKNFEIIEE